MASKKTFDAKSLRGTLAVVFLLIILAGAGAFYYGVKLTKEYSIEVNERLKDADASVDRLQDLQLLGAQIASNESLLDKADLIFTTNDNYQAQALNDLNNYANQTGLQIGSTQFSDPATTGTHAVTVEFKGSVKYSQLIAFLSLVEGNLPKMQTETIELAHVAGGDADAIQVKSLIINVSVR